MFVVGYGRVFVFSSLSLFLLFISFFDVLSFALSSFESFDFRSLMSSFLSFHFFAFVLVRFRSWTWPEHDRMTALDLMLMRSSFSTVTLIRRSIYQ